MNKVPKLLLMAMFCLLALFSCKPEVITSNADIKGFNLLSQISGHWVGGNQTSFGYFDWFVFDFRPISASHVHSIYEGATAQNIITSFFVADFEGKQQIMARNGGWLGVQYRATYFVLDRAEETAQSKYYRLVDAVGGVQRAYMELRFENDSLYFDAYKDNSGTLTDPIHHMGFKGANYNPSFAQAATQAFSFPRNVSEVDLNNKFVDLIDPDSALFLEENDDPFPKTRHGHLSDFTLNLNRGAAIQNQALLYFLSKAPIVDASGNVDFNNLNQKVVRTINIQNAEETYTTTYLHPDNYYITVFADLDNNSFPSMGDYSSVSQVFEVTPESNLSTGVDINLLIP